jgi:hypothetical protein
MTIKDKVNEIQNLQVAAQLMEKADALITQLIQTRSDLEIYAPLMQDLDDGAELAAKAAEVAAKIKLT